MGSRASLNQESCTSVWGGEGAGVLCDLRRCIYGAVVSREPCYSRAVWLCCWVSPFLLPFILHANLANAGRINILESHRLALRDSFTAPRPSLRHFVTQWLMSLVAVLGCGFSPLPVWRSVRTSGFD